MWGGAAGHRLRIDTRAVPPVERLAYWRTMVARAGFPLEADIDSPGRDGFHGELTLLTLGAVMVGEMRCSPLCVARPRRLIRRRDPQAYQLDLVRAGSLSNVQDGRRVRVGPGEMLLRDSSRPFTAGQSAGRGRLCTTVVVLFPRSELPPLPYGPPDRLVSVPISVRDAAGALLARHLTDLLRYAPGCTPAERGMMARVVLDLIGALCAREMAGERTPPHGSGRGALLARVHDFIERRLADPELAPQLIADAHQISVRSLHKLFEDGGGTSVAAWIRYRRLERCRRDLTDPALRGRPVHLVAARWGFPDRAHFGKLFRATYGISPGAYRTRARTDTYPARAANDVPVAAPDTRFVGPANGRDDDDASDRAHR
ncbi:helix-turn-helix domain-containing protein [Spirillospora sp. NPDC029432]|uniref:AraC-like ligand-binding domain-containing protein n=1 Tax=Spirillospora sp. NPDC029432 TaxID=3154599 RepID=UPI00345212D0